MLEKSPTSKLYTTWAHILSDRNVFAPRGEGEKRRGPMPPGLFTPPSGRGLVIPIFFSVVFFTPPSGRGLVILLFFFFFFCRGQLPQTFARSKQYLPVNFVRLAFIRQNFHEVGVENYRRFNGMKIPSMKARTKMLASFEAGMNLPNLPWHVNITSLKHKR